MTAAKRGQQTAARLLLRLKRVVRRLPYPVQIQTFRLFLRGLRPERLRVSQITRVSSVVDRVPARLRELIDKRGGPGKFDRSLAYHLSYSRAITGTYLLRGPSLARRWVTVEGIEEMRRASESSPVIVVQPHLGPNFLPIAVLLSEGFSVASLLRNARGGANEFLALLPQVSDIPADRLHMMPVPNPRSLLFLRSALRSGRIVVWQPDVPLEPRNSSQEGATLGGFDIATSPVVETLVKQTGAKVFIYSGHHRQRGLSPKLTLSYRALEPLPGASITASVYAAANRAIEENVQEWWVLAYADAFISEFAEPNLSRSA